CCNPSYLGPSKASGGVLYIDDAGLPFSLLSLESLGEQMFATSSKGGIVTIPGPRFPPLPPPLHFDFVGAEWQDIEWVVFSWGDNGIPIVGFSQLVTSVPGPPTLGLLGFGMILILGWRSLSSRQLKLRLAPFQLASALTQIRLVTATAAA